MKHTILVLESDPHLAGWLQNELRSEGYTVRVVDDADRIVSTIASESVDLVLLDTAACPQRWPELVEHISQSRHGVGVIVTSASASVRPAVEAIQRGATDYIQKPYELSELKVVLTRALGLSQMHRELEAFRRGQVRCEGLIGASPAMTEVFAVIEKVARSPFTTVLITGESGTGKELVARAIHEASGASSGPFVAVSCTAMQETLLESELFGHERGAFTDAHERKLGLFEVADGGSIFLDEIGDMDLRLQGKLLRALEEKAIRRVGGTQPIRINVRVIAATNRNLEEMVRQGRFREDLYYRLRVVPIHLPPLRERREDIPLLATAFVQEFNRQFGKSIRGFTARALDALTNYHWPGNVRELRNLVERIVLLEDCEWIDVRNLPREFLNLPSVPSARESGSNGPLDSLPFHEARQQVVRRFEREYLISLMRRYNGNVTQAARHAGVPRGTLQRLLKRHNLKSESFRPARP